MKNLKKRVGWLILGLILIVGSSLFRNLYQTTGWLVNHQLNHFEESLSDFQNQVDSELEYYGQQVADESYVNLLTNGVDYHRALEKQSIAIFIYQDGNLKFWSSNQFIIPDAEQLSGFSRQKNGYYYHARKIVGDKILIGQLLIKKEFKFENSYVENSFQEGLYLGKGWELSTTAIEGGKEIVSNDEESSLFLKAKESFVPPLNKYLISVEILGLLILSISFFMLSQLLAVKTRILVLVPGLLLIRIVLWKFKLPSNLQELDVFQSHLMAISKLIPSLGELVLDVLFVLVFTVSMLKGITFNFTLKRRWRDVLFLLCVIGLYALTWCIVETIENMVKHSEIPLDLSNILAVDSSTVITLICIAGIIATYLIWSWKVVDFAKSINFSFIRFVGFITAFYFSITLLGVFWGFTDTYELLWGALVLLIIGYSIIEKQTRITFSLAVSLLFIFSMMVTHTLREYAAEKNESDEKQLVQQLSKEKDLIAEYLYQEIGVALAKDSSLADLVVSENSNYQELYKYLRQQYFSGFWEKYDLQVTTCLEGDSIQMVNSKDGIGCSDFFKSIQKNYGSEIFSQFHFLDNNNGRISYMSSIQLKEGVEVFIELDSKFKPDGLGFPVLLLDKQIERRSMSSNYSFAVFDHGVLVKQKGVCNYSTTFSYYSEGVETWERIELDDFDHLIFKKEKKAYVLSKRKAGSWSQLAFYSYLFAFFSVLTVVGLIVYRVLHRKEIFISSFKSRFQGLIVFILFFSTVFIGLGSIYYLKNQFNEKNFDAISEKIQSVKIEVEHKLGGVNVLGDDDLEYVQSILEKFSGVFFTDINLYDPNGKLITSSQEKIFSEGLTGNRMDPLAMYKMLFNSHSQFVQIEDIEGMQYLSAYVPFFNKKNNLLGYLNLPYFARSNDLKNEISNFLVALLNIYALLIVIALVVALIITNKITEPLRIIQEKMASIQLGKQNELIQYKGKDEIGKLINEYNRMVIEIAESAKRLASSEREDAWREMAKQVAHEIKNPLTPMKLSIQHLQMRWSSMDAQEREDRFKTFGQNLVEQIDTLSAIASEFSSFAKLEDTNFSKVNLESLIRSSVDVYNQTNGVRVTFDGTENIEVLGDKDQLLRVFNNLIKNAIQAIPKGMEGLVEVTAEKNNGCYYIRIKDNGTGISLENQAKIFMPNFTTKNSGMGLGLAMVQKILENMQAEISFETSEGKGTEFKIIFPVFKEL